MPELGDAAPRFELPSTAGNVSLRRILGENTSALIAFYSEDGTPSCQTEISVLKDAHELLREFGAGVVAVSADGLDSHRAFAERLGGVPFPLAADTNLAVARAYGVVDDDDQRRARRAVFLVDAHGVIRLAIVPFQPSNLAHVEAIFDALGIDS